MVEMISREIIHMVDWDSLPGDLPAGARRARREQPIQRPADRGLPLPGRVIVPASWLIDATAGGFG